MNGRSDAFGGIAGAQAVEAGGHFLGIIGEVLRGHANGQFHYVFCTKEFFRIVAGAGGERRLVDEHRVADFDIKIATSPHALSNAFGNGFHAFVGFEAPGFIHGTEGAFQFDFTRDNIGGAAGRVDFSKSKH